MWLVVAAFAQVRLARGCVADRRLPWERRYDPQLSNLSLPHSRSRQRGLLDELDGMQ